MFRASPAKPHYVWGLPNLLRMFDGGILKTDPENTVNTERLVLVWLHEAHREYGDRLVGHRDEVVSEIRPKQNNRQRGGGGETQWFTPVIALFP